MIGVFDSGVGGLSVLREIHRLCPDQPTLYFADQAHVPYGPRPVGELRAFAHSICDFLIARGAQVIVIACNTATAAAINQLRQDFPTIPFVGMEPAIKPAAHITKTGRIGVMATAGTFKSQRYAQLMAQYAQNVQLYENSCIGLVRQIEAGELDSPKTIRLLNSYLRPMLANNIDTLILGCTHYPFVQPAIQSIVGDSVEIIDPARAVAQQAARLVSTDPRKLKPNRLVLREYNTNTSIAPFISMLNRLENVGENRSNLSENSKNNLVNNLHLNFYQKVHNN